MNADPVQPPLSPSSRTTAPSGSEGNGSKEPDTQPLVCTQCGERPAKSTGLCRRCRQRAWRKEHDQQMLASIRAYQEAQRAKPNGVLNDELSKPALCEQCGVRPPRSKGLCSRCYVAAWRRANPDKVRQIEERRQAYWRARPVEDRERRRAYAKTYNDKHRPEQAERNRIYNATHREQIREQKRAYRQEHLEEIRAKSRAHYQAHREELLAQEREKRAARSRARKEEHREELEARASASPEQLR